jgi:hypothetical protein
MNADEATRPAPVMACEKCGRDLGAGAIALRCRECSNLNRAHSTDSEPREYYIQRHASGFVGDCMLWWAKGGHGYTCDLNCAEVWTQEDAENLIASDRGQKFTAWEKKATDASSVRHASIELIDMDAKGIKKVGAS